MKRYLVFEIKNDIIDIIYHGTDYVIAKNYYNGDLDMNFIDEYNYDYYVVREQFAPKYKVYAILDGNIYKCKKRKNHLAKKIIKLNRELNIKEILE